MSAKSINLLQHLPSSLAAEQFETLLQNPAIRIERILSHGQVTPDGNWYDQSEDEWVLLLQGAGRIAYDNGEEISLCVGDSLLIPAHCRHRVSWTAPNEITVWLAVFYPAKHH